MANCVGRGHVEEPRLLADVLLVVAARPAPLRFERNVYAKRHVELLRLGEEDVVIIVAVRFAGHRELHDPSTLVTRLISMLLVALPPIPFIFFTTLEIVGAPIFVLWQASLGR